MRIRDDDEKENSEKCCTSVLEWLRIMNSRHKKIRTRDKSGGKAEDITRYFVLCFISAQTGGFGNFTFLMDLYRDSTYSSAYTSGDYPISVQLNQRLYIKYQVSSSQADLHVFAERCLATTTTSESSAPNHVFLDNG